MTNRPCDAVRYNDQMLCACGLAWDVNDTDKPQCPRQDPRLTGNQAIQHLRDALSKENNDVDRRHTR